MKYTVRTLNKSNIGMMISENEEKRFISLPFTVVELNCSDNITILKENFTAQTVKEAIKVKIQEYLGKLAEHTEFTIEV